MGSGMLNACVHAMPETCHNLINLSRPTSFISQFVMCMRAIAAHTNSSFFFFVLDKEIIGLSKWTTTKDTHDDDDDHDGDNNKKRKKTTNGDAENEIKKTK